MNDTLNQFSEAVKGLQPIPFTPSMESSADEALGYLQMLRDSLLALRRDHEATQVQAILERLDAFARARVS